MEIGCGIIIYQELKGDREMRKQWVNPEIKSIGMVMTEATSDYKCQFGCLDKHGRPKGYNTAAKLQKHYMEKHPGMVPPVALS